MTREEKIKHKIYQYEKYKASFKEVPAAFTRAFKRKDKEYTYLGMQMSINKYLDKIVEDIITTFKD